MRYQVVVLDEEIGSDFNIESLAWQAHPSGDNSAEFESLMIYMGLCAADQLGSNFEDNYIPGTKTLVYSTSTQVVSGNPDEWASISLDTDYAYDSAAGNLIIEVTWMSCLDLKSFYVRGWDTGTIRAVGYTQAGAPSYPTGSLSSAIPRLKFTGTAQGALEVLTFGAVKSMDWR
jgi:hypothetical protein